MSTAAELPHVPINNQNPAIVWLPPDGYDSVKTLWQDQYVWCPIAVDSTLPVQQTSFINLEDTAAATQLEEGETIASQVQQQLSPPPPPPPEQGASFESNDDDDVQTTKTNKRPSSSDSDSSNMSTWHRRPPHPFRENPLITDDPSFASDDTLAEATPRTTTATTTTKNMDTELSRVKSRRSSRADKQLTDDFQKKVRIADQPTKAESSTSSSSSPPPPSSRPRRRRSRRPRSLQIGDVDTGPSTRATSSMSQQTLSSDGTLFEPESQADAHAPKLDPAPRRRPGARRSRTTATSSLKEDQLALVRRQSSGGTIVEEEGEYDSVGEFSSTSTQPPRTPQEQEYQLSKVRRSNVPGRRRSTAPVLSSQRPREELPVMPPISASAPRGDSKLALRLDMNLDVEVQLKAKINGELMLTLFDD